jgi:hypothetical protein
MKIVNRAIRTYCKVFKRHIKYIDLWTMDRDCHTEYGDRFNRKGTKELVQKLRTVIFDAQTNLDKENIDFEENTSCLDGDFISVSSESLMTPDNINDSMRSETGTIEGESGNGLDEDSVFQGSQEKNVSNSSCVSTSILN